MKGESDVMWQKFAALCFCVGMIISTPVVLAESKHIEAVGEYFSSRALAETEEISEDRARTEAKRAAVAQAAVYIKSYSQTQGFKLQQDEVTVIAAQILYIDSEKIEKETLANGDVKIVVTIKASFDPEALDIKEILRDREELNRQVQIYKNLSRQYEEQKRANDEFKKNYAARQDTDSQTLELTVQRRSENDRLYLENRYMENSTIAIRKKNYAEGIELCQKILALNPRSSLAYMNLSYCHLRTGNFAEAINAAEKLLTLSNKESERKVAYATLGVSYWLLSEDCRKENPALAVQYGEKALAAYKKSSLSYEDIYISLAALYGILGKDYCDGKNYSEAIQTLEKGIKFVTENRAVISDNVILANYYFLTGVCYFNLNDYPAALEYMNRAVELNPADAKYKKIRDDVAKLSASKKS